MTASRDVLAVVVRIRGLGAVTLGDLLRRILTEFWGDPEFDADRPFGFSGWRYEVCAALIRAGLLEGRLDGNGDVEECDEVAADRLIREAIETLGATDG